MGDYLALLRFLPFVLIAVGVFAVGRGVWLILRARRFLRVAEPVPGVVCAHKHRVRRSSDGDRIVAVPVLRFRTRTGQQVEAVQSIALRHQVPDPQTEVEVLYDPADPHRVAVSGSTNGVTLESAATVAGGVLFTVLATNGLDPWIFRLF